MSSVTELKSVVLTPPRKRPVDSKTPSYAKRFWGWVTDPHGEGKSQASDSNRTAIRKRPGYDISFVFLIYLFAMGFIGLAAMRIQANLLFIVFGLMIGVLLISWRICRVMMSRLDMVRILPESVGVGDKITIGYSFTNHKKFWPTFSVTVSELEGAEAFARQPSGYLLHASANATAMVNVQAKAKRRGLHKMGEYQLTTSFPFGFIQRSLERRQEDALLVYPPVGVVKSELLKMCRSSERSGANMRERRGGSDEFYGVKQFRPGENPRWIYWKRSARTGELVSKEMASISPPRLMILADTHMKARTLENHAAVEKSLAMAATLAQSALNLSMAVGLCLWNEGWQVISPRRGKRHCRDILAALAQAPLNQGGDTDELIARGTLAADEEATAVVLTPRNISTGVSQSRRRQMIVISSESSEAGEWFEFDPGVDFSACTPIDQIPPRE